MNVVKSERKPRRNIQYKDLASAVSRIDNLEFLTDVIPKTTTLREFKEKKAKIAKPNARLSSGQTTLDNPRSLPNRPAEVMNSAEAVDPAFHLSPDGRSNMHGFETHHPHVPQTNGQVVFEHYQPNDRPIRDESEDVEMG
ncbi:MAG: hypothetical protein Q9219_005241 [cf. Caloplaca sp. 3 TL-2023]